MTDVDAPRSVTLGDLFEFSNGLNTDKSAYGSGTPFANVLEVITHEELDESKIPGRVNVDRAVQNRYSVRHGDVLFNRTSETQGEVGLASTYIGERSVVFGGFVLRGQPKGDVLDIDYSKWALRAPQVRRQIVSRGQGGIRANIGQRDLATVEIEIPSKSEQKAIAAALDDASALISSIERLIAKKRYVKQGLMQELLTGRSRLPGFSGAWRARAIGEFAQVKAGGTPSTAVRRYWGGQVRWMSSGEIHRKRITEVDGRITDDGLRESAAQLLPVGTVLMALAGQGKTRGTVALSEVELATNQSIAGILPSGTHDPEFLYYNLDTRYDELRGESAGDGGRGGLNLTIINKLRVLMPGIDEQRAVSGVLHDVDAEIAALGRRLVSARNVKYGMMQELLSGRTRLVSEVAA